MKKINLNQLKTQRNLDKMQSSIAKEILIYIAFLFFLFWITFSNLSKSSFQYNQLFIETFVEPQSLNSKGLADVSFLFFLGKCILFVSTTRNVNFKEKTGYLHGPTLFITIKRLFSLIF